MRLKVNSDNSRSRLSRSDSRTCYIMLILPLIGFFVFTLYPIMWAIRISFFSYDGIDSHTAYVGWKNFKTVFGDVAYWQTWLTNLKVFVFKMPVEALLGFITADILMNKTRFTNLYRSLYFMPAIISAAVTGLIFSNLFDYFGVINTYLVKWGIVKQGINWLENSNTAFVMVYASTFWASFGTTVLYYMAALSTVPKEVMESADIDGANAIVKMFKVKLPMIFPTLQVLMLLSLNGILHLNDVVLVLTGGAPGGQSHTIQSYLTTKIVPGFGTVSDIGYAAAMSIITSIIFCICALVFNKITARLKEIY